jgi:hypothetical protein
VTQQRFGVVAVEVEFNHSLAPFNALSKCAISRSHHGKKTQPVVLVEALLHAGRVYRGDVEPLSPRLREFLIAYDPQSFGASSEGHLFAHERHAQRASVADWAGFVVSFNCDQQADRPFGCRVTRLQRSDLLTLAQKLRVVAIVTLIIFFSPGE